MPRIKKENAIFGRYPCCDLLNRALRFMLDGNYESAREDVILAIYKADGYFYKDVAERLGIGEFKKRKEEINNE